MCFLIKKNHYLCQGGCVYYNTCVRVVECYQSIQIWLTLTMILKVNLMIYLLKKKKKILMTQKL